MESTLSSKLFRSRSLTYRKRTAPQHASANTTGRNFKPSSSMAEFNKVKQRKPTKEVYQAGKPIRIPIPSFFNVPKHESAVPPLRQLPINEVQQGGNTYLTGVQSEEVVPGLPAATIRKIKDLKVISLAMRRQKNLKEESRTHYCSGVLYDNIGNQRQAIDEYEKFLRIALFLQDRCSIELVLNSIGIAYMALQDYTTAVDYHCKQAQLAETSPNKFIGKVNAGICREKLTNFEQAFNTYKQAYALAEESRSRRQLAKELIEGIFLKAGLDSQLAAAASAFIDSVENTENNLMKSYVRLADVDVTKHDYGKSRVQYAKALQFGYLNDEPRKISKNKQVMKHAKLGYAISSAENKMEIFLKAYMDNASKYRIQN